MQYTITTYDKREIHFDSQFLGLVEKNMKEKTAFKICGEIVQGANIKHVGPYHEEGINLGSEMRETAYQVFNLPAGEESTGFWQEMLKINHTRGDNPWIFPSAVDYAKRVTSFTHPQDLVDFIRAEYETVKEYNKPKVQVDHELTARTKEFYKTEEGLKYLSKIRALGWN